MGDADQFIKNVFRVETGRATQTMVRFDVAPEITTPALTPDGILTLVGAWVDGDVVRAPWQLFPYRAVVDFKMEGDHVDGATLARIELRRHAAWVWHLENDVGADPTQTARYATLVVAPHIPEWLRDQTTRGVLVVTPVAPGCYGITPRDHPVVWIAANELPLHSSLVPFLWVRTGRPRVEFVRWLAAERGVASVVAVLRSHPMSAQIARQLIETPEQDEAQYRRGLETARIFLEGYPELAREVRHDAELHGLERVFAQRLKRPLLPQEHATLSARLASLGADRLGAVVLDLDRDALAQWLADPDAR